MSLQRATWNSHVHMTFVTSADFSSGRPTTLLETMAKADIWLIRTYWDLEFPHPVLPNFDFIGGLHCRPAKPLPKVNIFPFSCFWCLAFRTWVIRLYSFRVFVSNSEHHRNLGKDNSQQKGLYLFHHKSLHFVYEPCGYPRAGTVRILLGKEKI